jgi:MFS family permease
MNDKSINPVDVGRSTVLIYGSLNLPLAMVSYPLGIWVPRLYASDVGLSLALVGLVITAAALSDAVTDPVMGFLSDRWRTRWGRRKPWIFICLPLFGVAVAGHLVCHRTHCNVCGSLCSLLDMAVDGCTACKNSKAAAESQCAIAKEACRG